MYEKCVKAKWDLKIPDKYCCNKLHYVPINPLHSLFYKTLVNMCIDYTTFHYLFKCYNFYKIDKA